MPGPYHSHRSHHHRSHHHSHRSSRRGIKDPPGQHAEASTPSTMKNEDVLVPPSSIHVVTKSSSRHKSAHTDRHRLEAVDVDAPHDEYYVDRQRASNNTAAKMAPMMYSPARAKADMARMISITSSSSMGSTATPPTSLDDTSASAASSSDDVSSTMVVITDEEEIGSGSDNPRASNSWVAFSDGHDDGNIAGENNNHNINNHNNINNNGPPRHSSSTTFGSPSNNTQKTKGKSLPTPNSPSLNRMSSSNSANANGDEENGLPTAPPSIPNTTIGAGVSDQSNRRRRYLLIALAVLVLVAAVGVTCGIVLGGDKNDNGSSNGDTASAAQNNKAGAVDMDDGSSSSGVNGPGGSDSTGGMNSDEQEELFSSMQDGYGQQQTNDNGDKASTTSDGGVSPNQQNPAQDSDEDGGDADETDVWPTDDINDNNDNDEQQQPSSCADDPTWLVVVGDRYGKSVFTPYGCEWVATDPRENCNTVGATPSVSSINRIGEVATAGWIACPKACGSCSGHDSQKGQIIQDDDPAEDVSLTVGTVFESSPTSSKPTPAPTKRPTNKPTRAPVPVSVPRPVPSPTLGKVDSDADNAITCKSTAIDTNADEIALPFLPGVAIGSVDATLLGEASGLVASTGGLNPGILWTHNDALKFPNRPNNRNRIHAIDTNNYGDVIATYELEGAKNIDWEDVAYGTGPEAGVKYVYLGDIGDNDEMRREIYIYRVKEPDISDGGSPFLTEWDRLTLTYLDRRPRNVEAFLFDPVDEIFYLMTKTGGYIFSTPAKWGRGSTSMTLKQSGLMSEFRKQPLVGADISPDGKEILLKYYGSVKYFCRESESESVAEVFQTHDSLKLSYDRDNEPKGEAVAWAKEGFYTLSEQDRHTTTPLYFYKRSGH